MRIENRAAKEIMDGYLARLQNITNTIEREMTKEEATRKLPTLYDALNVTRQAIEECQWTYRNPRGPEIALKVVTPQSQNGASSQRSHR